MFRRTTRRSLSGCEDIHHSCTVRFLDETEPLTVTFQKDTKGQYLIDHVCQHLNLAEKDYFGLRYVDSENQRHWLEPLKSAYRQLKNVHPLVLCFRVKYYPSDPLMLKEELTRFLLFQQLRRDLHHGRLLCSTDDANQLSAYIAQSEFGDWNQIEDHEYVSNMRMLPKQSMKFTDKVADLHKSLEGQTPTESEENFLRVVSKLDTYGVDPHCVKDQDGQQMYIGITHLGIVTFQGNKRTHQFKWPSVVRLGFEGKHFIVSTTASDDHGAAEPAEPQPKKKKKPLACSFKCPSSAAAKHLWKCAVEQQYFYNLKSSAEAPLVKSRTGLLRRSSSFRFSGRCEAEACSESEKLQREPPTVKRSLSNPQIVPRMVRTISNLHSGSASLPRDVRLSDFDTTDSNGGHVPSSHSFDSSVRTRPDILSLNSSIPEESAVEIADTNYAPVSSPDEPSEQPVDTAQDVNPPKSDKCKAAVGDTAAVNSDQLPNGKGVQQAALSSADKLTGGPSRFRSVFVAVAAILLCTLIGALLMFEFSGTTPFLTSLHAVPAVSNFRRKICHPLHAAIGHGLTS